MRCTPRNLVHLAAIAALTVGSLAAAPDQRGNPHDGTRLLPAPANGQHALDSLGDRLPEAARRNGITPAQLRQRVRADHDLWLDESGQLRFQDTLLHVEDHAEDHAEAAQDDVPTGDGGTVDPSVTFELESLPGAQRTVFLDFDGYDARGSYWDDGWSGVNAPGYSQDSDFGSFNSAEHAVIQEVWARVAEDFAPFAVNVTTRWPGLAALERTSLADQVYGTVAAISSTSDPACSCGGVAYVGTFDSTNNTRFWPAWTFTAGVGTGAKNIAEATSHEVGHNLGLSHDGSATSSYYTGHNGWAPIMGVGYYEPITQWSRGEYLGATQTQDDLAVAVSNGAPMRADDHGNTAATATVLHPDGVAGELRGTIHDRNDVDVFAVTVGDGLSTFTVDVAADGPDLDVELRLLSGATTLATSNPVSVRVNSREATGMGASISQVLEAGTYHLVVDGVGRGTATNGYTDYASTGFYAIRASGPSGTPGTAPTAVATATPASGTAPLTVTLDGSASSDPDAGDQLSHVWNLGDGSGTRTGAVVSHTYGAGTWTATLTVTDSTGRTGTDTVTVTVAAEPTPEPPATPGPPTLTVSEGVVTVSWSAASGADSYTVEREFQHKNGSWRGTSTVAVTSGTSTTDAPGDGTYRYRVTATNDGGSATSGWSQTTVTGPDGGGSGGGGGKGKKPNNSR